MLSRAKKLNQYKSCNKNTKTNKVKPEKNLVRQKYPQKFIKASKMKSVHNLLKF